MTMLRRSLKAGRKYQNPIPTQVGGLSTLWKAIPLLLRPKPEKRPKVAPVFRTDPSVYDKSPASGLRITWFGHSSMLLEIDGFRILIDPVWDEYAAPVQWAGPKRFFAPSIDIANLPSLDAILISHDHYDHLGEGTVARLAGMANVRWITSAGVGKILRKFGVPEARITELDWTQQVTLAASDLGGGLTITALPARHFSGRSLFNRFETLWSAFVVKSAHHNVFYGADSGWWEGFAEIGQAFGPFDLTMLEIGAYSPLWGQIHLGPEHAVRAFQAMGGDGLLMPIHWGLFDLALHGWREPIAEVIEFAAASRVPLWSAEPGRPTEVVAGQPILSDWWRP